MAQVDPRQPITARPVVSPSRAALAVIVGSLSGAGLVAGWMPVAGIFTGDAGLGLTLAAPAFVIALPIWFVGLVVVGLPTWGVLRAVRFYSRRIAAGAGAILVGGAGALWMGALWMGATIAPTPTSANVVLVTLPFLAGMTVAGAIVGWVMARMVDAPNGANR